jgi:hypothetical protein
MNTEAFAFCLFLSLLALFTAAGFLGLPVWGL